MIGDPGRELDDIETTAPRHVVSTSFGRALGVQRMTVGIEVSCEEPSHSARTEMVNLLRALALDIETGLV